MAKLIHEVWEDFDEDGGILESCILAGPDGDEFRQRFLGPKARLTHTFEAGSYFEAMTIYHRLLGRPPYTTSQPWDFEPYPEEWAERQKSRQR